MQPLRDQPKEIICKRPAKDMVDAVACRSPLL